MDTQSIKSQVNPHVVWSVSMLSEQINFVQKQITKVNKTNQSQMDELEEKKRKLKQAAGRGVSGTLLEQHIKEFMTNRLHLLDEINQLNAEAKDEKKSIDLMNTTVTIMDREIARRHADHNKVVVDLREKREKLQNKLNSIIEVNEMVAELENNIVRTMQIFNKEVDEAQLFKTELTQREDLDDDQLQSQLKRVDSKIEEIRRKYTQDIEFMKKQRTDMEIEIAAIIQNMDKALRNSFVGGTEDYLEEIKRLEDLKLQASPSKQSAFDKAISFYRDRITKNELREKFDILPTLLTDESVRSDMSSRDSDFVSEDALYLKKYLGVPLTLALAEITAKQPRDPIHYLGHWLFKYRYNQEVQQYKIQEVDELTSIRTKIAKDKWNQFLEDEARKTILDIVHRAETQGDKNDYERELHRITEETEAMENEEDQDALDEEARDTLGEYNGPTVTQRRTPTTQN